MGKKSSAIIAAAQQDSAQFARMLSAKNINDRTPSDGDLPKASSLLHIAVARGQADRVELLLERGIDVNLRNGTGNTALMQALGNSMTPDSVTELLLGASAANVDLQNKRGQTALLIAAKSNNIAAVEALLRRRADPNIVNVNGDAPLHASLRLRLTAVAEALLADARTELSVHGKEAAQLVDPANVGLVDRLAVARAAARGKLQPMPPPRHPCRDAVAYAVLGLGCTGVVAVHEHPDASRLFGPSASCFLLPLFALILLYSLRG